MGNSTIVFDWLQARPVVNPTLLAE